MIEQWRDQFLQEMGGRKLRPGETGNEYNAQGAKSASGFWCPKPVKFLHECEAWWRPCGTCGRCVAGLKRDRTARAQAEAMVSTEVYVLLLTYRPDNPGSQKFISKHRSDAIKALRQRIWRDTLKRLGFRERQQLTDVEKALVQIETPKIMYFGVGETGSRGRKQKHWHVVIFVKGHLNLRVSGIGADGKLERIVDDQFWPHGWHSVDKKDTSSPAKLAATVRYVTKYSDKARGITRHMRRAGFKPDVVFFNSNSRPLGSEVVCDRAREMARAGLAWDGSYYVPGVSYSKKVPKGGRVYGYHANVNEALRLELSDSAAAKPQKNKPQGVLRQQAADAYVLEWRLVRPGRPIPRSEFILKHSSLVVHDEFVKAKPNAGWERVSERIAERGMVAANAVLPPYHDPKRVGLLIVKKEGRAVGTVEVSDTGAATFVDDFHGDRVFLPRGDLQHELYMLGQRDREVVERWLVGQRGADWLDHIEWHAAARALVMRRDEALLRSFKRGDNINPSFMEPDQADTALTRAIRLRGHAHIDAAVKALRDGSSPALKKPIAKRVA